MYILILLLSCSYKKGIEVTCATPTLAAYCQDYAPEARMSCMAAHLDKKLRNPKARKLLTEIAMQSPEDKVSTLRQESTAQGIQQCELADYLEAQNREIEDRDEQLRKIGETIVEPTLEYSPPNKKQ